MRREPTIREALTPEGLAPVIAAERAKIELGWSAIEPRTPPPFASLPPEWRMPWTKADMARSVPTLEEIAEWLEACEDRGFHAPPFSFGDAWPVVREAANLIHDRGPFFVRKAPHDAHRTKAH